MYILTQHNLFSLFSSNGQIDHQPSGDWILSNLNIILMEELFINELLKCITLGLTACYKVRN